MKILKLEQEEKSMGRKPKKVRMDHKLISKIANGIYYIDEVEEVTLKVNLKNGTSISYKRSENDDRFQRVKKKIDEELEDDEE